MTSVREVWQDMTFVILNHENITFFLLIAPEGSRVCPQSSSHTFSTYYKLFVFTRIFRFQRFTRVFHRYYYFEKRWICAMTCVTSTLWTTLFGLIIKYHLLQCLKSVIYIFRRLSLIVCVTISSGCILIPYKL